MTVKFCTSVLLVNNIKDSREFYEDILNQTVEIDHGECIGFVGGFSIWQIEHAYEIMAKKFSNSSVGNENGHFELYFESDDLDDMHKKLTAKKVEFVHDMIEQPWGQRVFRIYDPDKHMVELGEPMTAVIKRYLNQRMTPIEVAKRTSMPLEIVQTMVIETK
ncbi:VOC family protein [Pelosinus baikalensis]|uniref:Glyoxalase/bleomycin resistance/dioxygenase family protein n=1 Tax=Pelosinus baikalensis TaxID=2892015 RepID=A0ABS8HV66_9FIRM|nr:VOC family protein [Pelosinus baikalensis]MCC5466163.1 glyoxalase/bleomycin resistance/dioxygenase family protein [Pelosinus baikalensis]